MILLDHGVASATRTGPGKRSHYQVADPLVVGSAFGADFCTLLSSQGTCAHRPQSLDRRQGNCTNLRAAHTSVKRDDRTHWCAASRSVATPDSYVPSGSADEFRGLAPSPLQHPTDQLVTRQVVASGADRRTVEAD